MLEKSTIEAMKGAMKPFVDMGVIPRDEFLNAVKILRKENRTEKNRKTADEVFLGRKELMDRWSCSKIAIHNLEKNSKIKSAKIFGKDKKYALSKIEFYEETGVWPN